MYGATVYVRFHQDSRIKNMMAISHPHYKEIPNELVSLRNLLQKKYAFIVPMDFRYFYALEEFELMGVLVHYADAVSLVLELDKSLRKAKYTVNVTAGFGTVSLPNNMVELRPIDVLNQLMGHGVYSAFQYFKQKKELYPIYFYAYHHDLAKFNMKRPLNEEEKNALRLELQKLQEVDEKTERHTYYKDYKFK